MKKVIEWKTSQGMDAKVEITLTLEKTVNADGHLINVNACDLDIIATVDGKSMGWGEPKKINHPIAVATIGKLAMTQENFNRVNAALTEIKNTPEWIAFEKKEMAALLASEEYEKSTARINAAMNLGE